MHGKNASHRFPRSGSVTGPCRAAIEDRVLHDDVRPNWNELRETRELKLHPEIARRLRSEHNDGTAFRPDDVAHTLLRLFGLWHGLQVRDPRMLDALS